MKNIEEYKTDIKIVLNDMAKIEGYIDAASEHKGDEVFEQIIGDMIKNEIPGFMKSIDKLTEAMKRSFVLDYLTKPMEPDKISDVAEVYTSLEFISKQMKIIRTKHAIYYFNANK